MPAPSPVAPPDPKAPAAGAATLAHRLEYGALRLVAGLLGLLGVDRASATMGRLWRLLAPLGRRRQRRADAHLAAAMPQLTAAERRRILGAMWDNLGRTAAETLLLPRLIADRDRFDLDAPAVDANREDLARGSVFASLHQGNWELCGWGIHLAGLPVAAVYKPLSNPLVERWLHGRRAAAYTDGIYPREVATALKLRTLARHGVAIGMLADLRDRTGAVLPFFGRPARLATFPAVLARRLGVALMAGRVLRTDGARYRLEAVRIDVPVTADAEADILAATVALHAVFERWIAEDPGQWMWAHRKWFGADRGTAEAPAD